MRLYACSWLRSSYFSYASCSFFLNTRQNLHRRTKLTSVAGPLASSARINFIVLRWSNTKNIIFLSLMLSDCSFTMLLCELPWLKKNMLLIVMVAVVTRTVSRMLEFQHFCMHDFEWNIIDRNVGQVLPCYPRQCLGCELKSFHNNA